ncbi:MmgE/PrpD family protein [Shimia biformata]|uniref:MmgE/PrpD family protein n=1 Tax=Shimia biformata TaxID=1294299 RepID=UPI0019512F00|nr:MmgE/PrpD family protein [Shimia biformata]
MGITTDLARFARQTTWQDIPQATRDMLAGSLLDWMAVGIAGRDEPVSTILRDMVADEGGAGQASVFGLSTRVPARAAALANGTISHALDYDDTHFAHIGHPSVAIFPAVLAVGEARGASAEELRVAALIGIEASIRVGVWLGRDHYQTGFHQTATAGAFGAALAAGRLLGLDETGLAAALGLVSTRASGLKSQFGTMGKPMNAGIAASNGVEAAQLVARGFLPNPAGLEAPQGFGATHHGVGDETALAGLGATWLFDRISHKFHACCHGLHATLEALASLPAIDPDDVQKVTIRTHPRWLTVCNQPDPTTGLGAKFSYRMVTAMVLSGVSTAALESYTDALCADPALVALRQKVEVVGADRLTEMQAELRVELVSGDVIDVAHDLDAPMPLDVRLEKLRVKAGALVGGPRAGRLWDLAKAGDASIIGKEIAT